MNSVSITSIMHIIIIRQAASLLTTKLCNGTSRSPYAGTYCHMIFYNKPQIMEPAKYLLNGTLEDFVKIKCSKN